MATEQEAIAAVNAALDQIDLATTEAGDAVESVQARIFDLMRQIQENPNSTADITALAARANSTAGELSAISTTLRGMGKPEGEQPPAGDGGAGNEELPGEEDLP